jgi:benzoyl-CoA reductase subunit C
MSISELVARLRADQNELPFARIAEWRKANPQGKVVGCFPVYTPVELVHAAGMFPVLVAGAGGQLGMHQVGSLLQAFICSVGRSTPELANAGKLDDIDAMLFPSICEISRGLSGVMARQAPDKPFLYIHFPQNLESKHTSDYLVNELGRVKAALEKLGGKKIGDKAIRESFKVYNRRAELLEKLDWVRSDHPERLSCSDYYVLRFAGMGILPEEHIAILEEALNAVEESADRPVGKLRMILVGAFCERPPAAMIEAYESAGVSIVADDMLLGQRWWMEPLPISGDPLKALADHYIGRTVVSSVVHLSDPFAICDAVRQRVKERRADGVIVLAAKFCLPALSDTTCVVKACEENGLPYMRMEFEEGMNIFAQIRSAMDALMEARARLPFAGTENGGAKQQW